MKAAPAFALVLSTIFTGAGLVHFKGLPKLQTLMLNTDDHMDKTYRSKVDWLWLVDLEVDLVLAVIAVAPALYFIRSVSGYVALAVLVLLLAVALKVWMLYSTSYTITATELTVKSTCLRWRIPLQQIVQVSPCRDKSFALRDFAALSWNGLRVTYGGVAGLGTKSLIISPQVKKTFLDDLAHAAELERQADELVRAGWKEKRIRI